MVRSLKEMSHILGLRNFPGSDAVQNTGWYALSALTSIKERFAKFGESLSQFNFHLLSDISSVEITNKISAMKQGDYLGFSAEWWTDTSSGHGYTIHAVKEGDNTHFIYVNRGLPHYDLVTGETVEAASTVFAFTLTNDKAAAFSEELFAAAKAANSRTEMSKFMKKHEDNIDKQLSKTLAKKNQKTGNCALANSNISWHLQLSSDYMKENPDVTFEQAYKITQENYRKMRLLDRKEAFHYLLNKRSSYPNQRNYFFNYFQVLEKSFRKDCKNSKRKNLQTLIESCDLKTLAKLINPLLSENFLTSVDEYIEDSVLEFQLSGIEDEEMFTKYRHLTRTSLYLARNKLLAHGLQKLSQEEQEEIINEDISLLKGTES